VITQDPRTKHIPVVFISNMASSEQRIRGLLAGAVDYITKPFDFNEVKLRLVIHLKHQSNTQITDVKPVADVANNSSTLQPQSHRQTVLFHNARVHLLNSLATTLSMAELEKLTCSNSKQLNMAFKICTGVTVFEYLREERMKEARQLLQQTQTPIQDIAYEVGFTNSANFSSAFKERFGLSPRTFRQQTN
ncbi:MAG: helix-turn-helix domain-containing protein, partial [Oceanisphaera sp.]